MNEEMFGYCGYNCGLCAARSDDPDERQQLVDGWRRIFGHQMYTSENVRCDGCRAEGRIADFVCDKVRHLLGSREGMLTFCRPKDGSVTEEEYSLCMQQFNSMPIIVRWLVEAGKLGEWVNQYTEE